MLVCRLASYVSNRVCLHVCAIVPYPTALHQQSRQATQPTTCALWSVLPALTQGSCSNDATEQMAHCAALLVIGSKPL